MGPDWIHQVYPEEVDEESLVEPSRRGGATWLGIARFRALVLGFCLCMLWPQVAVSELSPPVTHPLDALSTRVETAEWLAAAVQKCREQLTAGDVSDVRTVAMPHELRVEFTVARVPTDGMIRIPLVIAPGQVTSVTLLQATRSGKVLTDEASLKSLKVELEEVGYIRAFRIARLKLRVAEPPFQTPRIESAAVAIRFVPPLPNRDPNALRFWQQNRVGIFRRLLNQFVSNPQDLERYIVIPQASVPSAVNQTTSPPDVLARSPFRMRIRIESDGLYRISGADLESSGVVGNWIEPRHLRLLHNGEDVPILFMPQDGVPTNQLRAKDALVFYGHANPSPFTARNVYWLVYDPSREHLVMPQANAPRDDQECESATCHLTKTVIEEDTKVLTRSDQFLSILGHRWVWRELVTSKPVQIRFDLPALGPVTKDLPAVLNLYVHSTNFATSTSVRLRMNGVRSWEFPLVNTLDDRKPFTIPPGVLKERGNEAEITLFATPAGGLQVRETVPDQVEVYLDNIEIWYPRFYQWLGDSFDFYSPDAHLATTTGTRAREYFLGGVPKDARLVLLDVTGPTPLEVPYRLEQRGPTEKPLLHVRVVEQGTRRYTAALVDVIPSAPLEPEAGETPNLRDPNIKADYIIIAYRDFIAPLKPLVESLRKEGHEVLVVDVQTVYDQFAHSEETPEAIKRFLDYAARHYQGTGNAPPATYVLLVGDATSAYRNEFRNAVINYVPSYRMATQPAGAEQWASDHWYTTFFGKDDLSDAFIGRLSVNNVEDLEVIVKKLVEYRSVPRGVWQSQPWTKRVAYVADHTEFADPVRRVSETIPPSLTLTNLFLDEEPWVDNFYYPREIAESKRAKVSPEMTRKIRDLFNEGTAVVTYFGHGSPNIWSTQRIWFGGDSENSDNLMLKNRDRLPFVLNMTCNSGAIDYPMPRWNVCISEDFLRVPNGGAIACYVPSGPGMTLFHEQFARELNRTLFAEQVEPLGPALTLAGWRYILSGGPANLVRMFILLGDPALSLHLSQSGGVFQEGPAKAEDFVLKEWRLVTPAVVDTDSTVGVWVRVKNQARMPARDIVFTIHGPGIIPQASAPLSFFPQEEREVILAARVGDGPHRLALTASDRDGGSANLSTSPPIIVIGRKAEERAPIAVDKTMEIEYRLESGLPTAFVRTEIYNLTTTTLSAFQVALEDERGLLVDDARTSVPSLAPGASRRVEIARIYRGSIPEREEMHIRVDPQGVLAGSEQIDRVAVTLGRATMPDLAILPGGILPHKATPVDGETVFFKVAVENRGGSVARNVRIDAYDGESTAAQPLRSRVLSRYQQTDVEPGKQAVLTVRWDPFRNAGDHNLLFRVWGASGNLEQELANNSQVVRLHVLEKYKLKPAGLTVVPPEGSGPNADKVRVRVKVRNEGESAAHGVKVVVYKDRKNKSSQNVLGEALIDEISPKSEQEIEMVYQLKPQDAGRRFEPAYDVFLKGSLQRVPWPE